MKLTRANWQTLGWETRYNGDVVHIRNVAIDSRKLKSKDAFFAYDGIHFKGVDFAWKSLESKAVAIFLDAKYEEKIYSDKRYKLGMPFFFSKGKYFHEIAGFTISYLLGEPSRHIQVIGVTGTNGKTTIAEGFFRMLLSMNKKVVYSGTLGSYIDKKKIKTNLTTPDVLQNHQFLKKALDKSINYAVFEASSHGLKQGRMGGIAWNLGIFTNLTPEHMDFHQNINNYYKSKKKLFEQMLKLSEISKTSIRGAIINTDDLYGEKIYNWLKKKSPTFPIIGLGENSDAQLISIQPFWSGYKATLTFEKKSYEIQSSFLGDFNMWNLATLFLSGLLLNFDSNLIAQAIKKLSPPSGRMQVIEGEEHRRILVDYAHSADALEKVLDTIKQLKPNRLIIIFGCGGDRDQEKRAEMGKIANRYADFSIITNDNPRYEDPQKIVNMIKQGYSDSRYVVVFDRKQAIKVGLQILRENEVLLIAGKGHEEYQIIGDKYNHFNDVEVVKSLMKEVKFEN